MSIFESIKNAIFPHKQQAPQQSPTSAQRPTTPAVTSSSQSGTARATSPPPMPVVDVEGVLEGLSAKASQPLNWRTSIVDLMKLLNLDSSLAHRQQLAKELGYTGDANDSATMNIWLHKQVMSKLAQSGGKVPESLKH